MRAASRVVGLERTERAQAAAHEHDRARSRCWPWNVLADPQHHALVETGGGAGGTRRLSPSPAVQPRKCGGAVPNRARLLKQHHPRGDARSEQRTQLGVLQRSQPGLGAERTAQQRKSREQPKRRTTGRGSRRDREQQHQPRRERRREQAGNQRGEHDVARVALECFDHCPSWARIAASLASPIPETSSSWSIEAKPPFCSR